MPKFFTASRIGQVVGRGVLGESQGRVLRRILRKAIYKKLITKEKETNADRG